MGRIGARPAPSTLRRLEGHASHDKLSVCLAHHESIFPTLSATSQAWQRQGGYGLDRILLSAHGHRAGPGKAVAVELAARLAEMSGAATSATKATTEIATGTAHIRAARQLFLVENWSDICFLLVCATPNLLYPHPHCAQQPLFRMRATPVAENAQWSMLFSMTTLCFRLARRGPASRWRRRRAASAFLAPAPAKSLTPPASRPLRLSRAPKDETCRRRNQQLKRRRLEQRP